MRMFSLAPVAASVVLHLSLAAPQPLEQASDSITTLIVRDDNQTRFATIPFSSGTLNLTSFQDLALSDRSACTKAILDAIAKLTNTMWENMVSSKLDTQAAFDKATRFNGTAQIKAFNGCGVFIKGPDGPNSGAATDYSKRLKYVDMVNALQSLSDWMVEPGNGGLGMEVAVKTSSDTSVAAFQIKSIPGGSRIA